MGNGRALILGCLAWYLAVLGLLVVLASWSGRRPAEVAGPPDQGAIIAAPPEGPSRHE
jgi:hypothetical protein